MLHLEKRNQNQLQPRINKLHNKEDQKKLKPKAS